MTDAQNIVSKIVMWCFGAGIILLMIVSIFNIKSLERFAYIFSALSFAGLGIFSITVVIIQSRKEPMEAHYYGVDYKYDGIKDEVTDNDREISKEEFFGKKEE